MSRRTNSFKTDKNSETLSRPTDPKRDRKCAKKIKVKLGNRLGEIHSGQDLVRCDLCHFG